MTTGLTAVLAFFFDYRQLVGMSNITVVHPVPRHVRRASPSSAGSSASPTARAASSSRAGPSCPLLGALGSLALFASADKEEFIFAGATLVVGVLLARLTRRAARAVP